MKYKLNLFLLLQLLVFSVGISFAQENKVSILFSVLNESGNFYSDLKFSDVELRQNKRVLTVDSIKQNVNQNLEVVIMIDLSTSQELVLPLVKKITQSFINSVLEHNKDKVAVVGFTGEVTTHQNPTGNFAAAKRKISELEIEFPEGYQRGKFPPGIIIGTFPRIKPTKEQKKFMTSVWDSVVEVSENNFEKRKLGVQKAILLMTDGVDTASGGKRKNAIEAAIKNNVRVYSIGMGDGALDGISKNDLKEITTKTGGLLFIPKVSDELTLVFQSIEQSLRSNYEAVFTPNISNPKDKLQEVKIEIINPELRARKLQIIQPKGFYLSN
jgi:VWFA-related protein